jgi:hypothetical protein
MHNAERRMPNARTLSAERPTPNAECRAPNAWHIAMRLYNEQLVITQNVTQPNSGLQYVVGVKPFALSVKP